MSASLLVPLVTTLAVCWQMMAGLGAWALTKESINCSDARLAQTDRVARHVWQVLDSSAPKTGAYCDSTPYPYAGGTMVGPASDIVARAVDELGCRETPDESPFTAHLRCEFDGDSYVIGVAHEPDTYGSPRLWVGVYRR